MPLAEDLALADERLAAERLGLRELALGVRQPGDVVEEVRRRALLRGQRGQARAGRRGRGRPAAAGKYSCKVK